MKDTIGQPGDVTWSPESTISIYFKQDHMRYDRLCFHGEAMTRREIEIARYAYESGMIRGSAREFAGRPDGMEKMKAAVADAYPLPTVTRPRELCDRDGKWWRLLPNDGLQVRRSAVDGWSEAEGWELAESRGSRAVVAQLLANPTEEVDE